MMVGTTDRHATTRFSENSTASSLTDRASSSIQSLKTRMDRESWDFLACERFAIMHHDGGIPEPLAKEKAYADTVKNFGPRPPERKTA